MDAIITHKREYHSVGCDTCGTQTKLKCIITFCYRINDSVIRYGGTIFRPEANETEQDWSRKEHILRARTRFQMQPVILDLQELMGWTVSPTFYHHTALKEFIRHVMYFYGVKQNSGRFPIDQSSFNMIVSKYFNEAHQMIERSQKDPANSELNHALNRLEFLYSIGHRWPPLYLTPQEFLGVQYQGAHLNYAWMRYQNLFTNEPLLHPRSNVIAIPHEQCDIMTQSIIFLILCFVLISLYNTIIFLD